MELIVQPMENEAYMKYDKAKKRVKEIKAFYSHIWIFIIVTTLIYITRFLILPKIGILPQEEGFIDWLNLNTYLLPALWALGIAIHGVTVYRKKFKVLKSWEQRKIQELIQKEEEDSQRIMRNN